jgi:hypothetical protein
LEKHRTSPQPACELLLLIFIVLSDGILLSQQPRTSKDAKFETVEDFIADQEAVRHAKLKFYKLTDPHGRFPLTQAICGFNRKIAGCTPMSRPQCNQNVKHQLKRL